MYHHIQEMMGDKMDRTNSKINRHRNFGIINSGRLENIETRPHVETIKENNDVGNIAQQPILEDKLRQLYQDAKSRHISLSKFIRELIVEIPDKLFYDIVADRFNIPVSKAALQERGISEEEEREYYSEEFLSEMLYSELASCREIVTLSDGRKVTIRKYYNRALRLYKWISIAKEPPDFIINRSDLTPRMLLELETLRSSGSKAGYTYVMKQAVGRILENVTDFKLYHFSIARRLKVRLDR
jgi:hypothetical protein